MKAWKIIACISMVAATALFAEEGKEEIQVIVNGVNATVVGGGGHALVANQAGAFGRMAHELPNTYFTATPRQQFAQSTMYTVGLGVDVDETGKRANLDALSYGTDRRSVVTIPVGAIDNPGATWTSKAIKIEDYFSLTPEQTKAVADLREEFKTQESKLAEEIYKLQLEQAQKVIALRKSFEQKANDILTGEDKKTKETLDTFMADTIKKNAEFLKQALDAFKPKDEKTFWLETREASIALTEKVLPNVMATEAKLLELVPAAKKAKLQEIIDAQVKAREQQKEQENLMQERFKNQQPQVVPPPQKPKDKAPGSF